MKRIKKENAQAFIEEIIELSKKHGLSLGHEDIGGKFEIHSYDERKTEWLRHFRIGKNSDFSVYRQAP